MNKKLVLTFIFLIAFLPGCITTGSKDQKSPNKVAIWWGTKEEVKTFLDSENAQAKRWVVESIGE
jgi:hypothetical protein